MPTFTKKKQPGPANAPAVARTPPSAAAERRPPRRKRRHLAVGGILLLTMVVLVVLLPTILVHTPLLGFFARRAVRLDGSLAFQSASLGWFSPTSITGIVVRDGQGETVLEADQLTINRSLPRLIFNSKNLGTLRIEKPRLSAKLFRDGSNLQTVLARWLDPPQPAGGASAGGSGAGVDLSVEVADGEATVVHQETQQSWHIANFQLAVDLARQGAANAREGSAAYQGEIAALQPSVDAATHGTACGWQAASVERSPSSRPTAFSPASRKTTSGSWPLSSLRDSRFKTRTRLRCSAAIKSPTAYSSLTIRNPVQRRRSCMVFNLGRAELKLQYADGTLRSSCRPSRATRGRSARQSELRLAGQPMEFRLAAGTLADHVELGPAACKSALRYVVPVLASATQSQGQFSIQLDGCRIPLGDLTKAEIGGRVIVHSATMASGPIVQQLTPFLSSPPSLVRIPAETVILFRMTGGRIYHQGLVLEFPELTMRTFGSVGLDDSLKLMIETSVPLTWLPRSALTDAIKKQKMQIPVDGTLQSPRLDLAELARVKTQVLGNLAHGVMQSGLGQQLNQLIHGGK